MNKKLLNLYILLLIGANPTIAQQWRTARVEVFGGISAFQYFGDIGGSADASNWLGLKDIEILSIRPGIYLGGRYQLSDRIQVKGSYSTGILAKSDVGSKNAAREYAFRTSVHEFSAQAEYYIIPESSANYQYSIMQIRGGMRHMRQPWSLYLFGGAAGLYYNVSPRSLLIDSPRFENDEKFTMAIPAGFGVKYAIYQNLSIGFELGGRYVFSDYLDGFKPTGSNFNDVYYSGTFKVNYKIQTVNTSKTGPPSKRRWLF